MREKKEKKSQRKKGEKEKKCEEKKREKKTKFGSFQTQSRS